MTEHRQVLVDRRRDDEDQGRMGGGQRRAPGEGMTRSGQGLDKPEIDGEAVDLDIDAASSGDRRLMRAGLRHHGPARYRS